MESNVRWHLSDCSKPNIVVEDGVPYCRGCHATSSVLVDWLVDQNLATGGDIRLPVDTPLGEANLWWPRSVPYCSPQMDVNADSIPCSDKEGTAMQSGNGTKPSSVSHIYRSSLDSNHFRLIYITESEDISSPIHIQLDEYHLNDHPEYETVSYVWGGEDGDSTLCRPVFVGRFWDVILATRNCSALLHHLRPRRGCRIIWLDAICINQSDNIEKPAQISRMGDIYANSERVVAYFGEDLVSRLSSGSTFRPSIDYRKRASADRRKPSTDEREDFLVTCANAAGISQDQLFQRRYLTRIWIVQELLLSKQAMFPLGGSNILCDREQARRLILRTAQKHVSLSRVTKSLSLLLKVTSHCHASDPRDRVYGLLGLFKPQDISRTLVSDYSLSWRDCWVGTSAYLLLVEKSLVLLAHAVRNTRPSYVPSWIPDIQNAGSWFVDFVSTIRDESQRPSKKGARHKGVRHTASGEWKTEFVMHSEETRRLRVSAMDAPIWWGQKSHRLVYPGALCTLSLQSAWVDASNGALHLQALRIFGGPHQLTMETKSNGITSIWVRSASAGARFRVKGLKGTTDPDERYQLFIISHFDLSCDPDSSEQSPRRSDTVLLALTTVLSGNDSSVVTLHDCCIVYDMRFYSMDHLQASPGQIDHPDNALHSLYWIWYNLHEVQISSYALESDYDWIFAWAFPSLKAKTRDIIPLLIRLTKSRSKWPESAEALLAAAKSICPGFDPDVQDNFLYLKIKNETMFSVLFSMWEARRSRVLKKSHRYQRRSDEIMEVSFTYPHARDNWTRVYFSETDRRWNKLWKNRKFPFIVRLPFRSLLTRLEKTTPCTAMRYARAFSKLLNEDLKTFLSRTPRPEDRYVFFEAWGRSLVKELGLVSKLERITIV